MVTAIETKREDLPKYAGWANYPTWAMVLVVDNEEYLYNRAHELVRKMYLNGRSIEYAAVRIASFVRKVTAVDDCYGCTRSDLREFSQAWGHRTYVWAMNCIEVPAARLEVLDNFSGDESLDWSIVGKNERRAALVARGDEFDRKALS